MSYLLTKTILRGLFGARAVTSYGPVIVGRAGPGRIRKYKVNIQGVSSRDISKCFWRLRQKNIIEFKEDDNGNIRIILTEAGKKQVLFYNLDNLEIKKPKRWDGSWHIVAFDIPEKQKAARNALGDKMRELGLLPFQKSLWIFPYNCKNEVDFISDVLDVGKYVHYIVTKQITNDELLRKRFDLF